MEPSPGRMHTKIAKQKVQVVYYLHRRGGHVEHPHLLEGFLLPAQDGLRLRDFKNWLSALRGKDMPDSFSWSYKRSYKAGYIWQDLSGDDFIHPLQKNEYVLMGFELQNQGSKSCKCGHYTPELHVESTKISKRQSSMEEVKLHELLKEGIVEYMNVSPSKENKKTPSSGNAAKNDSELVISSCPSFKAENLQTSLSGFSDCDDNQQYEVECVESPVSTKQASAVHMASEITNMPATLMKKQRSGEVKVYKAKEAEQTTDAATQTGESKRCSTEEALNTSLNSDHPRSVQHHLTTSLLLMNNHHHNRTASRSSPLPLFTPIENHFQSTGHGLLLKGDSLMTTSSHSLHDTEQDSYTNVHNNTLLSISATASNKSEMFYSPSSVHSSCTVLETVSPGSARSLRSVNSINSTRFSTTVDDHFHSSNTASNNAGAPSPIKAKLSSSTHLLKQLLSCGSVDISDSSVLSLKAMSLRNAPASTPINTRNAGTPTETNHERYFHNRSQSPHVLHQQCTEDPSPPTTPRSWLCRPCSGHSSCFTPLEVHASPHHLSREGSLKDIEVLMVVSRSPDSVASKRSPPLLPPLLNLNHSASPKTRGLANVQAINREQVVVRRSLSGGSRDLSSATNWTHMATDPACKKSTQERSIDASSGSTPHKASSAINKKIINNLLKRPYPQAAAAAATANSSSAAISPPQSGHSSDSHTTACSPSNQDCQRQLHYFTDINCRPDHHQFTNLYELVKSGSK